MSAILIIICQVLNINFAINSLHYFFLHLVALESLRQKHRWTARWTANESEKKNRLQSNQVNSICVVHICPSIYSFTLNFDVRLMLRGCRYRPRFRRNSWCLSVCGHNQSIDFVPYPMQLCRLPRKKSSTWMRNYCVVNGTGWRLNALIFSVKCRTRAIAWERVKWVTISTNWKSFQWIKSDWQINNATNCMLQRNASTNTSVRENERNRKNTHTHS